MSQFQTTIRITGRENSEQTTTIGATPICPVHSATHNEQHHIIIQ